MTRQILLLSCFFALVNADCYLHNPRGSNNRLNGAGANAGNQNRLFDSQNNAKGGYNVGVGDTATPDDSAGALEFYVGTKLHLEWTSQHACGDYVAGGHDSEADASKIRECEMVLQYMCMEDNPNLRNGFTEGTPPKERENPMTGQHEPRAYYKSCETRPRNKGLFTADRRLRGNSAKYTRQNNNGNRHGYECPEERDYYPYWHPTPWRDIAVLTNNPDRCDFYQRESGNVRSKGMCTVAANNEEDCQLVTPLTDEQRELLDRKAAITNSIGWYLVMMEMDNVGLLEPEDKVFVNGAEDEIVNWVSADKADGVIAFDKELRQWPYGIMGGWMEIPSKGLPPPECKVADWSRGNHLGNGFGGQANSYEWTIPESIITSPVAKQMLEDPADPYNLNGINRCVFRIRYNMSSSDYDNWHTESWGNYDYSVIKDDPKIEDPAELQLTMNTNQIGRTFQDRSHIFKVKPLPADNKFTYPDGTPESTFDPATVQIHNLNVRGKRGNIVQAYPAVEYDFMPSDLTVKTGDYVHIQWTGSNTNPRNYAGQGTKGTDRHNIMQMKTQEDNVPLPQDEVTMWGNDVNTARTRYMKFALLDGVSPLLNDAPANFEYPPVKFEEKGEYFYMCTRNNNFSNRSQKGRLVVEEA